MEGACKLVININVVVIVDEIIGTRRTESVLFSIIPLYRQGYADLCLNIGGLKFLPSILLQFCYVC
jgi:hypothetical protein